MIIPIVAGAILGLAFNFDTYKLQHTYIFDPNDIAKNLQIIPKTFTQSQYRLIQSSSDSSNLLDIDGDLSLKAKKGDIDLSGYGKYMMKTVNRENTVEMLITVYHETQTETFPSYTKVRTDWQSKPSKNVGTHYIRSITYGGQLIISYLLKANKDEYMEDIKAAVTANLAISGSLDVNVTGRLEKLSEEIKDKTTVAISTFATTGIFNPPSDIKALLDLVNEYPELVKKEGGGKGAPLKVDIVDLSTLNRNYTAFLKNAALEGMLNEATNKYDDLRVSWDAYKDWEFSTSWDPKWDKDVNSYNVRLKRAKDAMSKAISNLDPTKGLEQFDEAFKVYGEHGLNIPNRFAREFKNLTHHVENKPFFWFPYTTAVSSYVHWGRLNCTLPSPEPLFIGYAGTSPVDFGNGGNIECLPAGKPSLVPKKVSSTVLSEINGLLYELPDKKSAQTLCAFCKLENATVAYTISGRTECPEKMKLEYSGYLMSSRDAGTGSSFICLDKDPDGQIPAGNQKFADGSTAVLSPVLTFCSSCEEDENLKYVGCVVCSR
ncbi:uncharacterized protein LOC129989266 [Argiope bruennichi]|uniref:MACPF domain-containing protein n=1 Tax=Argiope bruennichi TaxID=94029 RepID=A0A8T0EAT8_ARGBR|nr:uncharacterized protein LOC129989266 [Argiope bruennichi]KAF8769799.1 hypothetical protein HNY73_017408 [Argiope bruennichi]